MIKKEGLIILKQESVITKIVLNNDEQTLMNINADLDKLLYSIEEQNGEVIEVTRTMFTSQKMVTTIFYN